MTVSSSNKKNTYTGTGALTVFPYTFRILDEDHLLVQIKDGDGVITTQTITTDYTVSGVGESGGGNVTMITAPASTETLIITRNMPFQQNTDYVENDAFPAESHEEALDELTMNDQQLLEAQERTLKLDAAVSGVDTTLPDPSANKLLGWNSAATALENKTTASSADLVISGSTANGVITYNSGTTVDVETNLKFDGTDLELVTGDVIFTAGDARFTAGNILLSDAASINDSNDNEQLVFQETASAVNHYEMTNAATGNSPLFKAVGTDANIDFRAASQGSGDVRLESGSAATILAGTSTSSAEIRLGEDTDNGTNYMGFKAPAAVTSSLSLTLPDGDGTSGQYLETDAAGTLSWASPAYELIASSTASASASVEFTDLSATYQAYILVITDLTPATDTAVPLIRTSSDNGSTFDSGASDYDYVVRGRTTNGITFNEQSNADTSIKIFQAAGLGTASEETVSGVYTLYNPSASTNTRITWESWGREATAISSVTTGGGTRQASAAVDAIQISFSTGNIASGEFKLYGLRA